MNEDYSYEKIGEDFETKYCPMNDHDGSITGHIVMNVPAWFDEHPAERKKLGWVKRIHHKKSEIDYDPQTQYLVKSEKWLDKYTVEDVYHVLEKSEEMMLLEELLDAVGFGLPTAGFGNIMFF